MKARGSEHEERKRPASGWDQSAGSWNPDGSCPWDLLFLGGFLFGGFQVSQGLEIAKDGLLLVAALGMFMIAGMLMVKGKNPEKFEEKDSWRKQFRVMGYKSVFGMICVAVLAAAAAVDYLMILMK